MRGWLALFFCVFVTTIFSAPPCYTEGSHCSTVSIPTLFQKAPWESKKPLAVAGMQIRIFAAPHMLATLTDISAPDPASSFANADAFISATKTSLAKCPGSEFKIVTQTKTTLLYTTEFGNCPMGNRYIVGKAFFEDGYHQVAVSADNPVADDMKKQLLITINSVVVQN